MPYSIAPPPLAITLAIRTGRGNGFTETYYRDTNDWEVAYNDIETLWNVRRALFTASHTLDFARISATNVKRDTEIRTFSGPSSAGSYVPTTGDTCPDDDALLIRLQAVAGHRFALRPLRLIPEECQINNRYVPAAAWIAP